MSSSKGKRGRGCEADEKKSQRNLVKELIVRGKMESTQKCKTEVDKSHNKSMLYRNSQEEKVFMGEEVLLELWS